jgi:hypothetical protein
MTTTQISIPLPARVETGPLKFNDDWTGVFIRGDNAIYYGMQLKEVLRQTELEFPFGAVLNNLADTLLSAQE